MTSSTVMLVLLRLFPSITAELVEAFLKPPVEGVVLQTYGAGNAPTARKDIMEALRSATKRGVLIVNCSQCQHGAVDPAYETGNELVERVDSRRKEKEAAGGSAWRADNRTRALFIR
ncbi:hypothetical protein MTO96_015219 [Rhipicephalus appendiculatus]